MGGERAWWRLRGIRAQLLVASVEVLAVGDRVGGPPTDASWTGPDGA